MNPWKRSDITSLTVLSAYAHLPKILRVDDYLVEKLGAPHKVVWTAMEREYDRRRLECGVNLRGGWLTQEGRNELERLEEHVGGTT